jgi:hypothetical protein
MISLTCTSCKKVLEIDDAFAGGVCRCQHCGTIQTVPSSLKKIVRPGSPGVGAKTLYQRTTTNTSTGSNSGSAPAKSAASATNTLGRSAAPEGSTSPTRPTVSRPRMMIALAIIALVVIISAAVAVLRFHS